MTAPGRNDPEGGHMPKTGSARLLMKRQQALDVPEVATFRLLPDLNVIRVGATSIIEGDPEPLLALVQEIAALSQEYQLLISTGGGERHRHALDIGVDLNMPIGVLAVIGAAAPAQNALILQALLASEGGIRVPPEHFDEIPVYLASGAIPVTPGCLHTTTGSIPPPRESSRRTTPTSARTWWRRRSELARSSSPRTWTACTPTTPRRIRMPPC